MRPEQRLEFIYITCGRTITGHVGVWSKPFGICDVIVIRNGRSIQNASLASSSLRREEEEGGDPLSMFVYTIYVKLLSSVCHKVPAHSYTTRTLLVHYSYTTRTPLVHYLHTTRTPLVHHSYTTRTLAHPPTRKSCCRQHAPFSYAFRKCVKTSVQYLIGKLERKYVMNANVSINRTIPTSQKAGADASQQLNTHTHGQYISCGSINSSNSTTQSKTATVQPIRTLSL